MASSTCLVLISLTFYNFNTDWIADLFNYCTDEIFCEIMTFATHNLEDLHRGNIGYIDGIYNTDIGSKTYNTAKGWWDTEWLYDDPASYTPFYGWQANQKIYFDTQSWQKLLYGVYDPYFDSDCPDYVLFAYCAAQIYDCNGNKIVVDPETGAILEIIVYAENATTGEIDEVVLSMEGFYTDWCVTFRDLTWEDVTTNYPQLFDVESEDVLFPPSECWGDPMYFDRQIFDCNGSEIIIDTETGALVEVIPAE